MRWNDGMYWQRALKRRAKTLAHNWLSAEDAGAEDILVILVAV